MAKGGPDHGASIFFRLSTWLLLAAAGALGVVCVWAEAHGQWYVADGALIGILFLVVLAGVDWWRQHRVKRVLSPDVETYHQALQYLLVVLAAGIIGVMIIAVGREHWLAGIVAKSVGTGILFAGSAFMVGVLIGFLFGFPPAPSSSTPAPGQTSAAQSQNKSPAGNNVTAGTRSQSILQNTNLQEISDWLTKVIVGAGLVELSKLPPLVRGFAEYMAKSINPDDPSAAVALVILGYFWSCGILFGYLWTRFEILTISSPPDHDTEALAAVDRWLNQLPGPKDDDDRAAMLNAIKLASAGARVKIFLDAERYRKPATLDVNERSLPVFQALVEADAQEIFHRNRAQNALALMGRKKDPKNAAAAKADWSGALDLLNDAIRIRDRSREPNWREYELARAVCRIHLDEQFNQQPKQKSAAEAQNGIRADLNLAEGLASEERTLIDPIDPKTGEGVTTTWKNLNPASAG